MVLRPFNKEGDMMYKTRIIVIIIMLFIPAMVSAAVIHVPGDQPTIQGGIDAASDGDTVLVADGSYLKEGNWDLDFNGKAITVRSGNGPEFCIIDIRGYGTNERHRGFYFHSQEGPESVVEGFTIREGWAPEIPSHGYCGAGICCLNASPTITNNIITRNHADDDGGGIYCYQASPIFTNNMISQNTAALDSGSGMSCIESSPVIMYNIFSHDNGYEISCFDQSSPTISDNTFKKGIIFRQECSPTISDNTFNEGGIILEGNCSPPILNNIIAGGRIICDGECSPLIKNNTIHDGGGIRCYQSSPEIRNNTIQDGAGIVCYQSSPQIIDNLISGNTVERFGAGIFCSDSSPLIMDNIISGNSGINGGGIYCRASSPLIINNIISDNVTRGNVWRCRGGGIYCYGSSPTIINCTIIGNRAMGHARKYGGGGIDCNESSPNIINCIISGNRSRVGGGIGCAYNSSPSIHNSIIADNIAEDGGGIYCKHNSSPTVINTTITDNRNSAIFCWNASATILNSILWQNGNPEIVLNDATVEVTYSVVQGGFPGAGNINAAPLFVSGPHGDYYLSQVAAGQNENSPCVDAGNPASGMVVGTTRTDSVRDTGIVDMGYHYSILPMEGLAVGPGAGYGNPPVVRVFPPEQNGQFEYEFNAYGVPHYGVNVTCGKVTWDGFNRIITGAGPGAVFGPHVRGFEVDGTPLSGINFIAYGTRKYGVNVAAGDIDRDGYDEIITGAGPGAVFGPHVRAFDYDGTPSIAPVPGVSYFAYGTRQWGVNVTCGDIDGDGFGEIITGPGPGIVFGPHIRGWDVDGGIAESISGVSFFAYSMREYGAVVGCGDVDGDGFDEIVTAPGPCMDFLANIRGWNYDDSAVSPLPGCRFFAWHSSQARYGAKVFAGADLDSDGSNEMVVGLGPDPSVSSQVKVFRYDGEGVTGWFSLQAFPSSYTHGTSVAAGRF